MFTVVSDFVSSRVILIVAVPPLSSRFDGSGSIEIMNGKRWSYCVRFEN